MKNEEFAANIMDRHPDTSKSMLKDLRIWLVGYTENQIDTLYAKYLLSQSSKFPPRSLFDFQAIATENGLVKQSEERTLQWWKCRLCGAIFAKGSRGCPKCGKQQFDGVIGPKLPTELIHVKDGCFQCKVYRSPFRPMGPSCGEYGAIDNGVRKPEHPPQPSQCHGCRCAACCAEEYQSRNGDKKALNALTGKEYHDVEKLVTGAAGALK